MLGGLFQLPTSLQGYLVFTFCLLICLQPWCCTLRSRQRSCALTMSWFSLRANIRPQSTKTPASSMKLRATVPCRMSTARPCWPGYVPATKAQFVVQRQDVVDALDNPAPKDLTPEYLILGGDLSGADEPRWCWRMHPRRAPPRATSGVIYAGKMCAMHWLKPAVAAFMAAGAGTP